MQRSNEQPAALTDPTDLRFQFSLRALLVMITVLAVSLSLFPWLTIACVCFVAIAGLFIAVAEFLDRFPGAFAAFAGILFAVIGTASIALIVAVASGRIEGHDASSKLIMFIVFGLASLLCYNVAWLAFREAFIESDGSDDSSASGF